MLIREGEDFGFVNLDGDLRPVELWIQDSRGDGEPGLARAEKADRFASFDGRETVIYLARGNEAYRIPGCGVPIDLLWPVAWAHRVLTDLPAGLEILSREEKDGERRVVVRERGAPVVNRRPAFLDEFDRETEFVLDGDSGRLTTFRRYVLTGGARRLFSELVSVDYLPSIPDDRFQPALPSDVRWGGIAPGTPEQNAAGPKEVAGRLLRAALEGDRSTLAVYCPSPAMVDWVVAHPPQEVVSLGEPFRSGDYAGVYVPYEVRWDGRVRSGNLALRNDNAERRWVFDGGI
jgi:hypothetical protein